MSKRCWLRLCPNWLMVEKYDSQQTNFERVSKCPLRKVLKNNLILKSLIKLSWESGYCNSSFKIHNYTTWSMFCGRVPHPVSRFHIWRRLSPPISTIRREGCWRCHRRVPGPSEFFILVSLILKVRFTKIFYLNEVWGFSYDSYDMRSNFVA